MMIPALLLAVVVSAAGPVKSASKPGFAAALEAFKKDPSDANREAVIKTAAAAKPVPAVPAEARRPFVMAATYQKEAKTPADFGLAVDSYREALKLAPWWGDAYYNLSVALESAGKLPEAKRALELYLLSKPKDAEAVQDRLFAMEAKEKLAAAQAEKARRDPKGRWSNGTLEFEIVEQDGALRLLEGAFFMRRDRQWRASEFSVDGGRVSFGMNQSDCPECFCRYALKLSESGDELAGNITSSHGTNDTSPFKRK
jgi:tetratricopeptide (TPR) repeat protein